MLASCQNHLYNKLAVFRRLFTYIRTEGQYKKKQINKVYDWTQKTQNQYQIAWFFSTLLPLTLTLGLLSTPALITSFHYQLFKLEKVAVLALAVLSISLAMALIPFGQAAVKKKYTTKKKEKIFFCIALLFALSSLGNSFFLLRRFQHFQGNIRLLAKGAMLTQAFVYSLFLLQGVRD